ncbi:MAG: peptide-methionine (S)-S-oxide reductase MsrA [Pseudomonadota bacterium]|nr:peptide-methionine (S)-S-oxide reductase MsrA [Pseudomonadota bacterium]MEC9235510.1 peptide-methionine (S)-S-oxide reductase MsrA [Pseudomonadota bacterium]MED5422653.1 peptide-methionine (S)-S-oxide reductase MsrA [Pseudomonadota bacterium]MEE3322655.1 peptide-methionine (S)-S-oxide reductase MsrA [Pseudomonadota bacterium]
MMKIIASLLLVLVALFGWQMRSFAGLPVAESIMDEQPEGYPSITLGGGCFWCLESEFRSLDGVKHTRVGYMGGHIKAPSYEQVTTARSGHAEVVMITYDPKVLPLEKLLHYFFEIAHDPTTLNQQGVDKGPQYRSAIFYANEEEKALAENVITAVNAKKVYKKPIVTTLEPAATFWEGEDYHQQYYEKYEEQTGQEHIRVFLKKKKKAAKGLY